jgi:putative hydrolase of the HAD superfamily
MINHIKVVCFDQGGTLLYRNPLKDKGKADYQRIMDISGINGDPESFGKKLVLRDKSYKVWSLNSNIEATEEVIWNKWLLPEIEEEQLDGHYDELTLLFSHSKGERVFRSDAKSTVEKLHDNGYLIALITNTVSRTLVPAELKAAGIWNYISSYSMSSITGIRKPEPHMFLDIASELNVDPAYCAYIGDAPNRDVAGPKAAGYGLSILLKDDPQFNMDILPEEQKPDVVISSLGQLLDLFKTANQRILK